MTTKTQLLPKFHSLGLLFLAFIPVSAITFATRIQAIESHPIPNGSVADTATAACSIATPTLDLPSGCRNAGADANREYNPSITSHVDETCSPGSFDLTVTYLPDGWTWDLSATRLNLVPDATGTVTLTLNPTDDSETVASKAQVAVSDARLPNHATATIASLEVKGRTMDAEDLLLKAAQPEPETDNTGVPIAQLVHDNVSLAAFIGGRVERDSEAVALVVVFL